MWRPYAPHPSDDDDDDNDDVIGQRKEFQNWRFEYYPFAIRSDSKRQLWNSLRGPISD